MSNITRRDVKSGDVFVLEETGCVYIAMTSRLNCTERDTLRCWSIFGDELDWTYAHLPIDSYIGNIYEELQAFRGAAIASKRK